MGWAPGRASGNPPSSWRQIRFGALGCCYLFLLFWFCLERGWVDGLVAGGQVKGQCGFCTFFFFGLPGDAAGTISVVCATGRDAKGWKYLLLVVSWPGLSFCSEGWMSPQVKGQSLAKSTRVCACVPVNGPFLLSFLYFPLIYICPSDCRRPN